MSELFSVYEDNLKKSLNRIKQNIDTLSTTGNFTDTFSMISQCDNIIKQMQMESPSSSNSQIPSYNNTLNEYKISVRKMQDKYNTEKNNSKLFTEGKEKGGLIVNEELAYSCSQKLEEVKRVLASTEDTSNKIMSNMDDQNQKFKAVNVKIKGMNDSLDGSNDLMSSMQSRLRQNKRIILIFAMVLLGILALTITMKIVF